MGSASQLPTTCNASVYTGCSYLTANYSVWCAASSPTYDCEPEFLNGGYYIVNTTLIEWLGGGCLSIGNNPTGTCINATNYFTTTSYMQVYGDNLCKSGGA